MRPLRPLMPVLFVTSGIAVGCGHGNARSIPVDQSPVVVFEGLDCGARPMRVIPHGSPRADSALERRRIGRTIVIVRDMRTEQPIPGAQASLVATPERGALFAASALADSAGHALLEAAPGSYYLRVLHIGYGGGHAKVNLTAGTEVSLVATIEIHAVCN